MSALNRPRRMMKMKLIRLPRLIQHSVCLAATLFPFAANAVSPESIRQGQALFEETWSPKNPAMGNDGLGPLFNADSCVACHHQGGVGGGGDSRFNAKTIAIQSVRITGAPVNDKIIGNMVRGFHPGFIGPKGDVVNNMPLTHHGGTAEFQTRRNVSISLFVECSSSMYHNRHQQFEFFPTFDYERKTKRRT